MIKNIRRIKKIYRKYVEKKYIEDVTFEISLSSLWRERLFKTEYNKKVLISFESLDDIPKHLQNSFIKYKLKYMVSKVKTCSEKFDKGLTIFKFHGFDFPEIIRYSANNEDVL